MQVTEHNGCVGCSYEDRNCHEEPCFSCYGTKLRDNYKRATNADRIRKMSDEELAEFLSKITYYCTGRKCSAVCDKDCPLGTSEGCNEICLKDWLQSEAEEST